MERKGGLKKTAPERGDMAVGQNLVPLVNIKIAGKWMFIPLKMVLIGIDPYPYFIANDQTSWDAEHWVLRHQIWRCPMFRQSHTFETTTNEGIAIYIIYIYI